MDFTLNVWRQRDNKSSGSFVIYPANGISEDTSFLEMLDIVNERLLVEGKEPIAYSSDCLEGICGTCSLTINGIPHGPDRGVTTCQLFMRSFKDGDTIYVEPFRAKAFPVVKDLIVDRSSFDRIIQSGGYISSNTGSARDANGILISKADSEHAMDAASCIGCGACVAACKRGSAMLFVAAKVSHLATLKQGKVEAKDRVVKMVEQMDEEGFGPCSNHYECEAVCPKEISVKFISQLNREYIKASLCKKSSY